MTNDEIRRKLDLPEPEDDEVGDAYRSPADIERDEEGVQDGGPFGGMFGDKAKEAVDSELAGRELGDEGDTDFSHRCLGGVDDRDLQHAPEWDRPLLEMYQGVTDPDSDPNRALVSFAASGTPEFVLDRIREAIMGGAMFSDFEDIPSPELMDFRQEFADAIGTDDFTLDSITESVMQFADVDRQKAEVIARSESSAVLNSARADGYQERDETDEGLFYWTGAELGDPRQTEACAWLIESTNPYAGGTPVPLNELQEMIDEAPSHDDDMANDLARPGSYVVHPQERSTFAKAPPGWQDL